MDGGRSPEASTAISGVLAETLADELAEEERERGEGDHNVDCLQYLTYTFLTVHRYEPRCITGEDTGGP